MTTCALVGATYFNEQDFMARYNEGFFDFIIAVDGGFAPLDRLGVAPDMAIGDFDSLGYIPRAKRVSRHPVNKDASDMELALQRAANYRHTDIYVLSLIHISPRKVRGAVKRVLHPGGDIMRIVLSGGGTAGHINPALALADVLRERGHEVLFAGTPGGIESRLVPAAGIPYKAFEAAGFNRNHPLTLPKAIMKIQRSTKLARKWFSEVHPDCVVGFGGYVCIPVARAAEQCGIPVVVHEQNSVMGMANKYLARRARAVCLTYDHAARALSDKSHVVLTGNPVRASVFAATRAEGRAAFGVPEDARMLLVTGGSLGARHLNAAIVQRKDMLLGYPDLHIVHVTGPKELDSVTEQLALTDEQAKRWRLMGYTDQMGLAMAAADAIVSRAGATSLAEISARHIPALLVPFPYATEDHQTMNARACVEAGAAFLVADADVEGAQFTDYLKTLVEDETARQRMSAAAAAAKTRDAAGLLADVVLKACESKSAQ